jgi:hypothetical protein
MFAKILLALVTLSVGSISLAEPNLSARTDLGGLPAYPDDKNPSRYYYVPSPLGLSKSENGQPALHLLVTRYVGTQLSGDQGKWVNRNILSVRFHRPGLPGYQKRDALDILKSRGIARPRLLPLPLYGIEGAIQYTPVDSQTTVNLPVEGIFKNAEDPSSTKPASLWTEREFSLSLGPNDAQLLLDSLTKGGVLISFAYAYLARSSQGSAELPVTLSGSPELLDFLKQRIDAATNESAVMVSTVHADAIAMSIEPENSKFHITRLDINDRLPPGYASLYIYCYDFQQEMVSGLYAKRVEIRARSPTGSTVRSALEFGKKTPEVYAQTLSIPFAVNFSEPFQYRVVSIFETGRREVVIPWTERSNWAGILDISFDPGDDQME